MDRERERKEDGNDRRYGKRESDGGTAKVEKIFANMRDERHGEAGREKDRGGENTRCKMSSSDPDLRRQGNRRCRTSSRESVSPETAKFLFELSSARLAIKKMYPVPLAHVFCHSTDRPTQREREAREKLGERRREEIIFDRLGN